MRAKHVLYVCPKCQESQQYAGFCDICNLRLVQQVAYTIESIKGVAESLPGTCSERFVARLLSLS